MLCLSLPHPEPLAAGAAPLRMLDVPGPVPSDDEVLVQVSVCGVCHTDLDVIEGRVVAPRYPLIPGHQIVGRVVRSSAVRRDVQVGDRVGIAWIHWACGVCRWCTSGRENLCPNFRSTGCDANGSYAELVAAPAMFVHPIPAELTDDRAAPMLCAGAIGWRSLRLAALRDGEPLGLAGFGASAHLVLQVVRLRYASSPVFVFARSESERSFARTLGAVWAGDFGDEPPAAMAAVIDTTPAWKPIVDTLPFVAPGGRLVVNAIRKSAGDERELARVDYARHLWMEREIKSVANVTRDDVREMLAFAAANGLQPTVQEVPMESANQVLVGLRGAAAIRGATVLRVSPR